YRDTPGAGLREVTEFLLPGLVCPCCGTVTFPEPPPGLHAGAVTMDAAVTSSEFAATPRPGGRRHRRNRTPETLATGVTSPGSGAAKHAPARRNIRRGCRVHVVPFHVHERGIHIVCGAAGPVSGVTVGHRRLCGTTGTVARRP